MQEEKQNKNEHRKDKAWIFLLLILVIGLFVYIIISKQEVRDTENQAETGKVTLEMEGNQAEYVKPEQPVDRSKNVALPGWGGFTIPAGTADITQGLEFHNPKENYWYEDWISIDGKELEQLVVDSGSSTALDHYLKLAGVDGTATGVISYDDTCFEITQNEEGAYGLSATGWFDGEKEILVETDRGEQVQLTAECRPQCYYITFGLFLTEGDELLYQSDLVAPGKYIQKMKMTRELEPGTYDAYVVCQPYRSDRKTRTSTGVVKISLTAE